MTETAEGLAAYRMMARIREFELLGAELLAAGELPGFIHTSVGQEAVSAGVCGVLRPTDLITTTHRGHGHCLAKGGDPVRMMGELFGAAMGYCKGRSGSMHVADPDVGILGANGIVGGGISLALGAAYALMGSGSSDVAVAFFGDGAVAEGILHESLNMAAIFGLPILFVCENNEYAEMMPIALHLSVRDTTVFADAHGITTRVVDGNDVGAVREAAEKLLAGMRSGSGPAYLECRTTRQRGHFEGDAQRYRPPGEVNSLAERDPLARLETELVAAGVSSHEIAAVRREAKDEMAAAAATARESGRPGADVLTEDVYADGVSQRG